MIERQTAFENDANNTMQGQQLVDTRVILEREALDILHGQISAIVFDYAVIYGNNIGVIEAPGDTAFRLE